MNYLELCQRYHYFDYLSYQREKIGEEILLTFQYRLSSETDEKQIDFTHRVKYKLVQQKQGNQELISLFYDENRHKELENFIFHIGLVEIINYWKLACPKNVRIFCGYLEESAQKWWKKLFYHGLGEFIFLNQMAQYVNEDNFVRFEIQQQSKEARKAVALHGKGNLIPVGGGKDSVVTLEVLKKQQEWNLPFVMSAPVAAFDCIEVAGYDQYAEAKRIFDPKIMEMNQEGYLNGHVPFSAILAFISVFAAALAGRKYIPLSNERSANEPSVLGTTFNHQYSKSFEFERDFDQYLHHYLATDIDYFSLLRPLYEIQIGEMFSQYKAYHPVYRSCNRGKASNSWCGKCAKCLFVYIILSPYLEEEELVTQFGKNLYDDHELVDIFEELIGIRETKPFECVGTIWEVRYALGLYLDKRRESNQEIPYLLQYFLQISGDQLSTKASVYEEEDLLPLEHRKMLQEAMEVVFGGVEN
ncbi:MAG: hypothetical protein JW708_04075 [Vallitaleaceae bacterium]|nr:hypothetical protein [Vallitaleaceae bacterium]